MQNTPRKPQQYIDGFINNRPRRQVSAAPQRPLSRAPQPTPRQAMGAVAKPLSLQHGRPAVSDRPLIPKTEQPKRPIHGSFGRRRPTTTDQQNKKSDRSWRPLVKRGALVVLALFVISGGWLGWKVYRNTAKVFGNKNPLHILSAFKPVPLKGEDKGRVTVLLAGNSADRSDGGGGQLTDSIMLLSINTKSHDAFMLSIPRDMWVNIPDRGHSKINAANTATDFNENGYAKGGMGMLEKVITDNFGIPINYYALVNYTAFKDAVNNVGGIDVNIQSTDPRGLYDPSFRPHEGGALKLPNGVNHLNGQIALNLARARGDPFNGVYGAYGFPQSDFDRTTHQRQMMFALKEKTLSMNVLSNPNKVGNLMDSVGNNVSTDFQINELVSLYHMMKNVKSSNIQSLSLNSADGKNLLMNYRADNGQSALAPAMGVDDFSQIQAYLTKVINTSPVSKEAAQTVVLNGGDIAGLAKAKGDEIAKKGLVISTVGDAPKKYSTTTIIDNSKGAKPATKKSLKDTFKNSTSATDATLSARYPDAQFIIILGGNEKSPTDQSDNDSSTDTSNI